MSAKTMAEATRLALEELGLEEDEVEVEVIKKGKPGILGMGAEDALVRVTPLGPAPGNAASPAPSGAVVRGAPLSDVPQSEVSETAQEILSSLLEILKIPATVQPTEPPPQGLNAESQVVTFDIQGEDLGILIGRRGQTLASLQYLVNLAVSHRLTSRVPVLLDVEGYKRRRFQSLEDLAERVAQQVADSGQLVALEPMPPNERRIIHMSLAEHPRVSTESMGMGEGRKVVILPRQPS
ncbi:MAG: RNA-binding cell elongation regulator Jag/EloR [Dehalococcoidia bacterium]